MIAIPLLIRVVPSLPVFVLFENFGLHHVTIGFLQKIGMLLHLKRHLSLVSFGLAFLHILNTLSGVA